MLFLFTVFFLLAYFVPVLAIIQKFAHRRIRIRGNFDQIITFIFSHTQALGGGDNADLLVVRANQPDLSSSDLIIYPDFFCLNRSLLLA